MNLIEQDKQQRLLALDPAKSFIVQAPAGSGKTELLIQRFLTLLIHVKKPEEILAITFTKKAANEMRLRIIKALKQATDPEPASDHAKKTWLLAQKVLNRDKQYHWNLIYNPNQLRIQTIDSLCSYLTKQLPLLSHFGSSPDITDNTNVIYREAIQQVLLHIENNDEWSQAIAKILLHLDNDLNKLHDLLVNLLAKRDQWLPYIQFSRNEDYIKKQLEQYLALIITDSLSTLVEIFPKEIATSLLSVTRFAADNLASLNKEEPDILACRQLIELPGTQPQDKQAWIGIAKLLLTKSFSWRKRVDEDIGFPPLKNLKNPHEILQHNEYRKQLNQLITSLSEREDLRLGLTDLFYLPKPYYQDSQWEILQSLLQVLRMAAAELRVIFQQYGQIDFIENAQAALVALGSDEQHTDLALALDYHIQHILVDEFQDTSFTQYQLLEKLTTGWLPNDGHTLFVVGDPMQSIYRFREAEVGLFIRMRKMGIGQIKLIPLTLAMNFRSHSTIVEWNNAHFHSIFPSFNDMATGAVTYSASVANREEVSEKQCHTAITIRGFVNAEEDRQAKDIVELILQTKNTCPSDKIAILVRSRSHLKTLIPILKKANLSYSAIDIDPLASRQHIQDLLSLTCALLHPADRIAWLSILRAPWCGLDLADLLIVAGKNPYATIWEQLENDDIIQQLSVEGQQRVNKLIYLLKNKMAERERYALRYWIESTWLLLGGPACLQDGADMEDAHAFFELLDKFSHPAQLIHLSKLKDRISQLYASTQHKEASLQIMTIHTAKGLEFDTVILPELDRKLPNDDKSLLQWMERPLTRSEQTALLLAPIHATGNEKDSLYEYINRQQRIKSAYETDRLFYVATTRAKKHLHLFFNIHRDEKNEYKIESGSFLEKLWPFLEKNKQDILIESNSAANDQDTPQKSQRYLTRLATAWQNPIQELATINIATHMKQSGFMLPDTKPKLIGIVTHRVFQHVAQMGITGWNELSSHEQFWFVQHQFKQLGLLQEEMDDAIKSVLQAIQCTLTDTYGKWILHSHHEAKSEFAITATLNGKIENLVIDRTFVDENDIRWIIDFKTTTPSQQNIKDFLVQEQKKYSEQMHKYCEAMRLIDTRTIRLGLYFPMVPAWCEWRAVSDS